MPLVCRSTADDISYLLKYAMKRFS